ncbi:MAG TPA: sodium-translocating pyrophosphatase [Anaerolineae bacterium]|nr:sodium-translocating pyrophosphatase [Anaerolineae bacterium]
MESMLFAPVAGLLAMAFVAILAWWVSRQDPGTPLMREIASYIREGANAFLKREFRTISYFIVVLAVVLLAVMWPRWQIAFGFVIGALLSMLAVIIGMNVAVRANVRTTNAARSSAGKALTLAFRGGATMGLSIVALDLLGISLLAYLFGVKPDNPEAVSLLVGFGFGASLSSLFAQLGGGIYTKAADVGADLVGKVEVGIPEDDPRNAAVIADLVGDNVGDCAGRGADLFESGADNLIAATIVSLAFLPKYGWVAVIFPLLVWSIGAIGTVIGVLAVRGGGRKNPLVALNTGFVTAGLFAFLSFYCVGRWIMRDMALFWSLSLGLLAALAVSLVVQYYTGMNRRPVIKIAEGACFGSAINIMTGLSYGMESAMLPIVIIALVTIAAYFIGGGGLDGIYAITAATLGITAMTGIIMASDAFGPIVDNASGIAEMAGLGSEVRDSADVLDAVGNITKAITKGYGMACALMTCVVVLFAYLLEASKLQGISVTSLSDVAVNLAHPISIAGIFIGATVPFLFSAQAIRAVSTTAFQVVEEVRRQFREIPGLLERKAKPDYSRCVDISTKNALREMVLPTLTGVVGPVVVGFTLGVWALAAYLIAAKVVGAILATFMFNAGGAWDNAKKYIEDGHFGGKGSEPHRAAVIGDTLGDPLKDTAGPSLHILIKLQNILSITLLPLFLKYGMHWR